MPVTGVDDIAVALPGTRRRFGKASFSPQAAGAYFSTWNTGSLPPSDSPGGGVNGRLVQTNFVGATVFPNAASGKVNQLARAAVNANQPGMLIIFDRLWENSGLNVTSTSAQAIAPPALDRPDALGANVEPWLDIISALGGMPSLPTIVYTDQDGNTGNAGQLIAPTGTSGGRAFPFSLAAGDTGVRAITSYNNVGSLVSGNISLVLRRRLAEIEIPAANLSTVYDWMELALPYIDNGAALEFVWAAANTSSTAFYGTLTSIQV